MALSRKFYRIAFAHADFRHGELGRAVDLILQGKAVQGPYIAEAERVFSPWTQKEAAGTSSGEAAIHAAIQSIGRTGDVIIPSYCCGNVYFAVTKAGGRPRYVDVNDSYNVDASDLEDKITSKTIAVVAPSLYGLPAELEKIEAICRRHDVFMVDDAAQCLGAFRRGLPTGSFGDAGVYSFAGKTITATGGGMLVGKKSVMLEGVRSAAPESASSVAKAFLGMLAHYRYRRHALPFLILKNLARQAVGRTTQRRYGRICNLDAFLAVSQHADVDWVNAKRTRNASLLCEALNGVVELPQKSRGHVYSKFVVQLPFRAKAERTRPPEMVRFVREMAKKGIECEWCYVPLHLRFGGGKNLENTERVAATAMALPNHVGLTEGQVHQIANAVKDTLKSMNA